jgi:hypothetical protein
MAYPVSLSSMILQIRQMSNTQGMEETYPDNEIIGYFNGSFSDWNDEVRGTTWGGQYKRAAYPFLTTAANLNPVPYQNPPPGCYYPLPPDFVSLISLDGNFAPNVPISCIPFSEENRNAWRGFNFGVFTAWTIGSPIYYQVWGDNLILNPGPQGIYQMQLNYVPACPVLSDPNACFDSINGWEQYIVLDAAIKVLIKARQEELIPVLEGRLEQQRARIRIMAARRDMTGGETIHETESYGGGTWPGF